MTDNDSLSDEDKALFRAQMRSVKPLKEPTAKTSIQKSIPSSPSKKRKDTPLIISKKDYFLSDFINETVHTHSVLDYSQPGVPNKRLKELKSGQVFWEAKLDLHGMYADAARDALCLFIEKQFQKNTRCVLIVHGKGGIDGAPPVIKNLVNRWLPQMDEVLAFHSALAKDGGHGALYVLLKRNRQ